jgi:glycosyltransferase involved in cell wall biosynthesis
MKLSVILPIYNGEKTLVRTLDSLLAQSFQDFELIACIDGTKDNSQKILESYSNKFKSLQILTNHKNLGLGANMNRLVAHTNGEYIAVAEQDDVYYPERFALQIEVLDNNPDIGMVSGIADFWNGEKITMRFPGMLVNGQQYPKGKEMFLLNYRNQIKVANSCMMFRKSVHVDNGLYFSKHYPNVSVDWSYVLRFSLVSEVFGIHQSLVLLDRRNDRNSITSKKKAMYQATHELLRSFKYEYPELITKQDFKYAKTTQHLMELSSIRWYKLPMTFFKVYLQNPRDKRWGEYIKKRFF